MVWVYLGFIVFVLGVLALDLGVFHRKAHVVSMREALGWSAFWIALGLAFSNFVYFGYDNHWMGLGRAPDAVEKSPEHPQGRPNNAMGQAKPNGEIATKADARLYPRGRLIIFTSECVLKDIPNPHWHGLFPVIRITLDPLPWTLLGASIVGDLIPLQDSLNEALRGADDGLAQWVRRSVAADKRPMPKSALDALDTRAPGMKMHYNPAAGEPFKLLDGPAPQVFNIYKELIEFLKQELEDTGGTRGVTALAQMGQMPSADTMERYMEALSALRARTPSTETQPSFISTWQRERDNSGKLLDRNLSSLWGAFSLK